MLPFPSVFACSSRAHTAESDQIAALQKEVTLLTSSLAQISQQKLALGAAIQDTEATAQLNHSQLAQQLHDEKELLELRVSKMVAEQTQMSMRLAQAEETVRAQNELAEKQYLDDKAQTERSLTAMAVAQQDLIHKIQDSKNGSKYGSFTTTKDDAELGNGEKMMNDGATDENDDGKGKLGPFCLFDVPIRDIVEVNSYVT